MFSSLASFLFGSNTNCEANSETTATATVTGTSEQSDTNPNLVDVENLIEVTSLTPSVTGAGDSGHRPIKRGRNKRNNARQQNKREANKAALPLTAKSINIINCDEEEIDEDDWFIVEKEGEDQDLCPARSDSEGENVAVPEAQKTYKAENVVADNTSVQQRSAQHINSHSLYSGPRPHKQRNFLQKTRNNTNNRPGKGLSVSTLSPSRTVNDGRLGSGHRATGDGSLTRSLCVVATIPQQNEEKAVIITNGIELLNKMEESWFVTPPPCFISIGPINMQTSPYENLLIEHPSMSVYHSIKSISNYEEIPAVITELDSGVNETAEKQKAKDAPPKKNSQAVQTRASGPGYRLDRQTMAHLKQELMARNVQKIQNKNEQKDICRSAMNRANKVRDVQSKNHTKRRSDRQHSKIFSNANNNRKSNCC